jgi:beta-galactosidase
VGMAAQSPAQGCAEVKTHAGIHLYNIPAYLGDRVINSGLGIGPFRSPLWTGEDAYDFSGLIKDFEEILDVDP